MHLQLLLFHHTCMMCAFSEFFLHIFVACWHVESIAVGIIGMFFVGIINMLKILGFFLEKSAKQREDKKHAS